MRSERTGSPVPGADSLRRVYEVFDQLATPLSRVTFPDVEELADAPPSVRKAMDIVRDAFQLRYPVQEKMTPLLARVDGQVREALPLHSPEGMVLRHLADQWLEKIQSVDVLTSSADLTINLAPSLLLDETEEGKPSEDVEGRHIRLPVAVANCGSGFAHNVEVQIQGQFAPDGPTSVSFDVLDPDEAKVATFRLRQRHEKGTEVVLKATYSDLTHDKASKTASYEWPPFAKEVQGPIHNPFVIGRSLEPAEWGALCVGRNDELRQLLGLFEGDRNRGDFVFVRGLRRTGKTSLILRFQEEIKRRGFLPAYIDCYGWEKQIESQSGQGSWVLRDFLTQVASVVAAQAEVEITEEEEVGSWGGFREFLQRVQEQASRLVLIFDEADSFGEQPFAGFGGSALDCFKTCTEDGVHFVFVHGLTNQFWDAYYGKEKSALADARFPHVPVRVGLLKEREVEQLALRNVSDWVFTPLAMRYLWMVTGGYPALAQLICHHLVEDLNARRDQRSEMLNGAIETPHLKTVVTQIVLSEDDRSQVDYLALGFSREERHLLLELGRENDIDVQTGLVKPVKVGLGENRAVVCLKNRDECTSEREYRKFRRRYATKEKLHAFQTLLTKQILEREGSTLRIRVGFLWLYLHELQKMEEEVQ
jgi:hypothetical protein